MNQAPPTLDDLIALIDAYAHGIKPDPSSQDEQPDEENAENSPCIGDFQMHRNGIHRDYDFEPIAPYGTIPDAVFYESVGEGIQAQTVGPLLVLRLNKRTERAVELWIGEIDSDTARTLPKSVLEPHRVLCAWLKENSSGEIPVAIVDALDISSANPFIRRHGSYVELCCRPTKLASDVVAAALAYEAQFPSLTAALQRLAEAIQERNEHTFRNRQPKRSKHHDEQRPAVFGTDEFNQGSVSVAPATSSTEHAARL